MTTYTPGPWRLRKDYAITAHCDETETHEPIARAYGNGSIENLHANSRLIAAAPELLACLIDAVRCLDFAAPIIEAPEKSAYRETIAQARAAIAKATGGAK